MSLPFTADPFLDVFASYNAALWPVEFLLWLATLILTIRLLGGRTESRWPSALLTLHWVWAGLVYHALFFTRINPAAWIFAALFAAQGAAFLWLGIGSRRQTFALGRTHRQRFAAFFLVYALAYPVLVLATGHDLPRAPIFGVPCPTTIFTVGMLLASVRPVPRWLAAVPIFWSLVGGSGAFFFGVTPDFILFVAAAVLVRYVLWPSGQVSRTVRATRFERIKTLAGDQFIPDPVASLTHAVTIHRDRRAVWPWLVQMGAGTRAGWYSYDVIDSGRRPSADRIRPELQSLNVGMVFPALPGRTDGFVVLAFEPERFLVLTWRSPDGTLLMTWAFVLEEPRPGWTRLIVRARGSQRYRFQGLPPWLGTHLVRLVHFIMQRRQLVGIARRAERQPGEGRQPKGAKDAA